MPKNRFRIVPPAAMLTIVCLIALSTSNARMENRQTAQWGARRTVAVGNQTVSGSLRLSEGREVVTRFEGAEEAVRLLEQNRATPVSLARGDFDSDGIDDLVIGYAGEGTGIVSLLRGNPDAIYPHSPEAQARKAAGTFTETPFLSPALVTSVAQAPDYLGTGDFDGDDYLDLVVASRGNDRLIQFSGDGAGRLRRAVEIELPGSVTALTSGEINRADGLTDLVVGAIGQSGAAVLVYEGPLGALRAQPEIFPLPAPATDLAIGQLDEDPALDLAVAAGNRLMLIHGRDRRLSLNERERAEVKPAKIEEREIDFKLRSLCLGEFSRAGQPELALLSEAGSVYRLTRAGIRPGEMHGITGLARARLTAGAGDDLMLIDPVAREVRVAGLDSDGEMTPSAALSAEGEPVAVLPLRLNQHARDSLVVISNHRINPSVLLQQAGQTYMVNKTDDHDDGQCTPDDCTLREAIIAANANPGPDRISFNIRIERSVAGVVMNSRGLQPAESAAPPRLPAPIVITHASELPEIVDSVVIDGTTQPRFAGSPLIRLRGTRLFITTGDTTLRGLSVHLVLVTLTVQSPGSIENIIIEGNFIGDDASEPASSGFSVGEGIYLSRSSKIRIGGPSAFARNVISGNNGSGIEIERALETLIQGNYIGTDSSGHAAFPNRGTGINIKPGSGGSIIQDNVISGNDYGIGIENDSDGRVQGNRIGVNAAGTKAIPNLNSGITAVNIETLIGGATPDARNIISGNGGDGIALGRSRSRIQGNFIGTDTTGRLALGNSGHGIYGFNSGLNIGGKTPETRNVISGNLMNGVQSTNSTGVVENNFIGVDSTGTVALPNSIGINHLPNNLTTLNVYNNLISGNSSTGIQFQFAGGGIVQGNKIGLDVTGMNEVPNGEGVLIVFCPGILIGGRNAGDRNIISGNLGDGLTILDTRDAVIQGNFIGTDASGTRALPNRGNGLMISISNYTLTPRILIGGDTDAARNVISGNGENGIAIGLPRRYSDRNGAVQDVNGGEGVTVERNFIGADVTGEKPLGNGLHGIFLDNRTFIHTIKRNRIAFNKSSGVFVPNRGSGLGNPGVQIRISENSIFENGAIGIDLGEAGPTPNHDPLPTPEANDGQNYPDLSRIVSNDQNTTVEGTLKSRPNATFVLEFFSNQGVSGACRPEGRNFNYSATVTTDASGQATFNITFPKSTLGGFINATATNSSGNRPGSTSEFSTCQAVAAPPSPRIQEITVLPDSITAIGAGFTNTVQVFVDGVAFETPAIVEAGRKVIQRGKLVNGQSIAEAIPPKKLVRLTFRNSDGGVLTATFRN